LEGPDLRPENEMPLASLHDLYVEQLRELYDAEAQVLRALLRMGRAAAAPELRLSFQKRMAVTEGQLAVLARVFGRLGEVPRRKKCKGMAGLIAEAREAIDRDGHPAVRDAALIAAGRRMAHYEMAGYGYLRDYALLLGDNQAAALLDSALDDEAATAVRLTDLAHAVILHEAEEAPGTTALRSLGVAASSRAKS
jgi:ferritin-like metal-binding protein YciE